jgi:hypothetical protein
LNRAISLVQAGVTGTQTLRQLDLPRLECAPAELLRWRVRLNELSSNIGIHCLDGVDFRLSGLVIALFYQRQPAGV